MSKKICIISGPTASGKTSMSIKLAKEFGGEIINFDSLLFYKELTIGTAKPTLSERDGIAHHMIDIRSISNPMNAAEYRTLALPILEKLLNENKQIYLVGGSGFYLQALIYGMYESITTPSEIINQSNELYKESGIAPFIEILSKNDPKSLQTLHENDHYRIRRAAEHFLATGTPFSEAQAQMKIEREIPFYEKMNWKLHHIYLDLPKPEHFEIIQKRTITMFEMGLLDEVKELLAKGFSGEEKPLKSIGYKEALRFLESTDYTLNQAIEDINIATRQLAKSQRTWFKKWDKLTYHPLLDQNKISHEFNKFINE